MIILDKKKLFAMLPSVDEVLGNEKVKKILEEYPRTLVLESIREAIDAKRKLIINLDDSEKEIKIKFEDIIEDSITKIKLNYHLSLKKVINGTGVILHTNLGRSLLSESIKDELWESASRYSNLEYNIDTGERGSRYVHLVDIIKRLTGAEDVLVVNNNAAAVLLALNTLAKDGEVIVSRGELVEVGGSFRIPSIMSLSGAKLVEVGATNKTHISDYEEVISENTKVLMKVHTSNYKIIGFTENLEIDDLSLISKKYSIPLIEDLGSGVFIDLSKYGLSYEPTVLDSINKGADIVTFSGDKMLGGPQAGIIVGKKKYIQKMKKNQLTRALRVDKITICALEATLRIYLDEKKAIKDIPTLRMLTYTMEELYKKVKVLFDLLNNLNLDAKISVEDDFSQVGGGSMPIEKLNTYVISIIPNKMSVSSLERKLRLSSSNIIGRIYGNKYILDIRTIFEDEFEIIAKELNILIGG
ncbi:L-seryl-tRNA(Sec) selenium transferase [Romboutsia ilealis]|uniref:L-seryl-tRNA(Sec) selenium transferase n=2 Tax=Romboutsia faecis TaxID=2764597 RepID=A0ABR7JL43_9FIRM|nr:L-seryl-tRNA(Sec) selenium transferase [Romboutsia faecis]MRN23851.1 L-seryl-tRNA(Sec) selenium transferase [Romboutsia ilealis]